MNPDGTLQLEIDVDTDKGNANIAKSNASFAKLEETAASAGKAAAAGIDNWTLSMAKAVAGGELMAEGIKKIGECIRDTVKESIGLATTVEALRIGTEKMAEARGVDSAAADRSIDQMKKLGFSTTDATVLINKMLIARMALAKAPQLAEAAKDISIVAKLPKEQVVTALFQAIETGQSRVLNKMVPALVDLAVKTREWTVAAKMHGQVLTEEQLVMLRTNEILRATVPLARLGRCSRRHRAAG
jgi:hypothetical protein